MHPDAKAVNASIRPEGEKARILVADDDATMRELTAGMLRRLGYEVITAPDGDAALKAFQQSEQAIHLVISDGLMPGLGGPELLRAITDLSPSTPTLLISGSPGVVCAAGPAALAKPFRADTLAAKVRALLDASVSSRANEKYPPVCPDHPCTAPRDP